jgi:hypothetical protein
MASNPAPNEYYTLPECDAVQSGRYLQPFRSNIHRPHSGRQPIPSKRR